MKIKTICAFLVILSVFIHFGKVGAGATDIFEDITTNTRWTKTNSPYIIHNSIVIDPYVTLTIEAGVEVRFEQSQVPSSLIVKGNLVSNGTAQNKVTFSGETWQGIEFYASSTVYLENVLIKNSKTGLSFYSNYSILKNLDFENNRQALAFYSASSSVSNIFVKSNLSLDSIDLFSGSWAHIASSTIQQSGGRYGIGVYSSHLLLTNSILLKGQNGVGIFGGSLQMEKSSISNFITGIQQFGTNPSMVGIERSRITDNEYGIESNQTLSVSSSTIANNSEFGIANYGESTISATNNFWGDASGPKQDVENPAGKGNLISEKVVFRPWLQSETIENVCCSNVIFLPGIQASRLYDKGPLYEDQLWEPNINGDVEDLYLNAKGESKNKLIYTRDIIQKTNICPVCGKDVTIYEGFSRSLDTLVASSTLNEWAAYPYDWRLDMNNTILQGTRLEDGSFKKIKELLASLSASSKTGKVTFVAHSNGGLFLKLLISQLQKEKEAGGNSLVESIDKVVLVGVPQFGTPLAIAGLLHGDKQNLTYRILLNEKVARGLGENMTTAYGLLPSSLYPPSTVPFITFDDSVEGMFGSYGANISSREKLSQFLLAELDYRKKPAKNDLSTPNVLSKALLEKSSLLHKEIDTLVYPSSIETFAIGGVGVETVAGLKYYAEKKGTQEELKRKLLTSRYGDGTVMIASAFANIPEHYYLDLSTLSKDTKETFDHTNMMETEPVKEFVQTILEGKTTIPNYLSKLSPLNTQIATLHISVHSPVSLSVFDSEGRRVGRSLEASSTSQLTFISQEIPGSTYYEVGEEKYIVVPATQEYSVELGGTGTGSFSLIVEKKINESVVASSTFTDIPTLPVTEARLEISANATTSPLRLDLNGDEKVDAEIDPNKPEKYKKVKAWLKDEIFLKIEKLLQLLKQGKIKEWKPSTVFLK